MPCPIPALSTLPFPANSDSASQIARQYSRPS